MEARSILDNKYYLYVTEFFAGMSVMAVELGASRLLAPYFSSSQIVWTIIIGTIMIAMALGNIWGGRSADKNPNPDKLYMRMIIAAIWIAAIPLVGKYVILVISTALVLTVNNNFLVLAAFVSCMIIFVFPLFLLGTVTPSLVKYTVDSLDDSGDACCSEYDWQHPWYIFTDLCYDSGSWHISYIFTILGDYSTAWINLLYTEKNEESAMYH
ncbi:MAG: hypothetical protein H6Q70_3155 [Firmicutes bacterium]|nr:hypothetical protein [Bacillota bacterium]